MGLDINDVQIKILKDFITDNIGSTSGCVNSTLEGILQAIELKNSDSSVLFSFVNKYKYTCDSISEDKAKGTAYIPILVGGYEYYAHWSLSDVSKINLNDFLVDYVAVVQKLEEDGDIALFGEAKDYENRFKKFKSDLKDMGISLTCGEDEGYDVLATYTLPTNGLNDEAYINEFSSLIDDYKAFFESEMNFICG